MGYIEQFKRYIEFLSVEDMDADFDTLRDLRHPFITHKSPGYIGLCTECGSMVMNDLYHIYMPELEKKFIRDSAEIYLLLAQTEHHPENDCIAMQQIREGEWQFRDGIFERVVPTTLAIAAGLEIDPREKLLRYARRQLEDLDSVWEPKLEKGDITYDVVN